MRIDLAGCLASVEAHFFRNRTLLFGISTESVNVNNIHYGSERGVGGGFATPPSLKRLPCYEA